MSQHDFDIANQTASNARADINDALQALASLSSGPTAPSTTYAYMLWPDTANNILKMRSEADDAWINVGYLDQTSNAFRILDDTQVVNTSGTQTGLLGDQATSAWEAGTSTTESLVSPAKVKSAINALASAGYTDAEARTAQAGHSAGAVGSYCFAVGPASDVAFGSTTAGSNLRPTSALYSGLSPSRSNQTRGTPFNQGTALSGTWRAMGTYDYIESTGDSQNPSYIFGVTLWLRIS